MQGLVTIGTAPGIAEAEVAEALCGLRSGARSFVVSSAGATAPLVAAKLAGAALDPEALLDEARRAGEGAELLVVTTTGGLMAPITERYSNRDLARELALPVVLAAPAAPGLTAGALLALDSARGNGLAVAAIVIAGWPDPPSRGLLGGRGVVGEEG